MANTILTFTYDSGTAPFTVWHESTFWDLSSWQLDRIHLCPRHVLAFWHHATVH